MKATRKVVADAIECLLTCAAARQAGDRLCTYDVITSYEAEKMAGSAWYHTYDEHCAERPEHIYGAAASLLHEGWLPDGWTR